MKKDLCLESLIILFFGNREEDAAGKDGDSVRLNAPVFKKKTLQEYG